jgi:hypothetical protein
VFLGPSQYLSNTAERDRRRHETGHDPGLVVADVLALERRTRAHFILESRIPVNDGVVAKQGEGEPCGKSIIDTYNNDSHRILKNNTPNQVYRDNDDQMTRHLNDSVHNQKIINLYHLRMARK